jgi:class 3 adenylate cyclase/tetratricopeptide (TPR) repeat protein
VLFADLTGYTALAASLDPEEVYRFLRPAMRELQRIVEGFGGTVPQIMGDGFMAVFGVPLAHEDDAERAVRAALAVRDHVVSLNTGRKGLPFPEVHAGVNSGEVMVAPADEHAGFAVIGDTVNTASRLADLASGGHVLVDTWTRDRTGHSILYGPPRVRRVKGKREPIATHEAIGLRGPRPGPRAPRVTSPTFFDREHVLERLDDEVARTEDEGRSRVLVVTGDAGVGKSRLAKEVRRRLGRTSVLSGRCAPFGERLPLSALAEAVAGAAGVAPGAAPRAARAAVTRLADRLGSGAHAKSLADDLHLLLGTGRAPSQEAHPSITVMIRAARSALEGLARAGPVTVVLDDVHWADPDLVQLLGDVSASPWTCPVLFLGFARPEPLVLDLPTFELDVLPQDAMEGLATEILGGTVPEEVLDAWIARAAGNPLFLEEGIGMLIESGALVLDRGTWRVVDPHRVDQVPSTIRLLIAARLDGLPPDEKRVLQDASVSGDATSDLLIERLTSVPAWRPALRALEARGLLRRSTHARIPGAVEYEFKHVLIREVAYEGLPKAERVTRHLQVAEWFEEITTVLHEEPVAGLAYHYERAWRLSRTRTGGGTAPDAAGKAARYLTRWAEGTFVYEARSAEAIFQRALAASREAEHGLEPEIVAKLLIGLAETLIELGRHEDAMAATVEARRIATRISNDGLLGRALLALGRVQNDRGQPERARRYLRKALALFEASDDLVGQGWALHRISEAWSFTDFRRELEYLRKAHAMMVRGNDVWGQAIVAQDLAYLLTVYGGAEFQRWYDEARRLARDEGDTRSRASILRTHGYFVHYQGRYAEAVRVMREARPVAIESGDRYAEADTLLIEAMATSMIASPGAFSRVAREAIELGRDLGSTRIRALGVLVDARATLRGGDPARASRRLAHARTLLGGTSARPDLIEASLMEASMHLDRGSWTSAIGAAGVVFDEAVRLGWRMWEPQGPLIAGRAHLGAGRFEAAVSETARAVELATRSDAVGLLELARAVSEQAAILDGRRRTTPGGDGGDPERSAILHECAGLLELRRGRWLPASEAFADAVGSWDQLGLTIWLARGLALRAHALRSGGDGRRSASLMRRAAKVLDALGTPSRSRTVVLSPVPSGWGVDRPGTRADRHRTEARGIRP